MQGQTISLVLNGDSRDDDRATVYKNQEFTVRLKDSTQGSKRPLKSHSNKVIQGVEELGTYMRLD